MLLIEDSKGSNKNVWDEFGTRVLKDCLIDELQIFSSNLNAYLISTLNRTGGHYSSPLGATAITVAIHWVFESPQDAIIFDTGHQCYAHKIITGRGHKFAYLRKYGGLSGFPNPSESSHDPFCVGHAGTALAIAIGLSLTSAKRWVIAVIGDAAFASGTSLEALMLLFAHVDRVLIIVNDNHYAISPSVSSLNSSSASRIKALAEASGLHFAGSINGDDPREVAISLISAKKSQKSAILHAVTTKGYGDKLAELDPTLYHLISVAPKAHNTTQKIFSTPQSEISRFICDLSERHPVIFFSPGMARTAGFDEMAIKLDDRYIDVGIAEHSAVSIAGVAALHTEFTFLHIYSTFLPRAADALLHDVGVNRSPVVFLVDRCGLAAEDGPTHHGINDLTLLRSCPGMEVFSCATEDSADLMEEILSNKPRTGPIAFRLFKGSLLPRCSYHKSQLLAGWLVHRVGSDLTIITHGRCVEECIKASVLLVAQGIECRVVELLKIHPLSSEELLSLIAQNSPLVIVEEMADESSVGRVIAASLAGLTSTRLISLCVSDPLTPHGSLEEQWKHNGLDDQSIAKMACQHLSEYKAKQL